MFKGTHVRLIAPVITAAASICAVVLLCTAPPPEKKAPAVFLDYTVLWTDSSKIAFRQCSRPAPEFVARFIPTSMQVDTMLFDLRKNRAAIEANLPLPLESYCIQAIGFNKNLVYLNCFASRAYHGTPDWRAMPIVACGGGGDYWGVVYAIERREFEGFERNR